MSKVNSEIKLKFVSNEPLHLEITPTMRSFPFTCTQRSTSHTVHTHTQTHTHHPATDVLHEIRLTPMPPSVCMQMKQSAHQTGKLQLFTIWLWNCWGSDICQAFSKVRGNKARRRESKCLSVRSGWNTRLTGAVCQHLQYQCLRETCMIRIMVEYLDGWFNTIHPVTYLSVPSLKTLSATLKASLMPEAVLRISPVTSEVSITYEPSVVYTGWTHVRAVTF